MRMPALALFERALRLESRSWLTCAARIGLLVVILFILLPVQTMGRVGFYGAPGLYFLESIAWTNLVFITLAGLSYFASAITEEKEEMTLGLLRMTDLNPIAILLGKSTSRLVGALLLLLVQVPFLLLAVTLGGVGVVQIAAAYAALLAYMFFLANLALFFSVIFRNTATAGGIALLLLIFFFFGHYWALWTVHTFATPDGTNLTKGIWPIITSGIDFWRRAAPPEALGVVFRTGFSGPVISFQVVSNLVLGVLFFLLSWLIFDWSTRHEKDAAPPRRILFGRKSRRSRIPPHLVGPAAITWKDFMFIGGGKFGVLMKFLVVGLMVGLCNLISYQTKSPITQEFEGGVLIWCSFIATGIWLALESSRIFKDEVRWKTLSSLMTLPISVRELAYRKVIGALAGTLPLLGGAVIGGILVPDDVASVLNNMFKYGNFGGYLVTFSQFILFFHLVAFLSLVLKRGALPLAIGIQVMGIIFFMFISGIFMFMRFNGGTYFIAFGCLVVTAVLHRGIGYRLVQAAAQE
jgi:ABC-type transport system involved in multi-copper enzyme maturation permease subunit